jgi:glycosyltransferase involved in cell wall biosynthesis
LPIIGLATTEMVTVVENGVSGFLDTNVDRLVLFMKELLADPGLARHLSEGARRHAQKRFNISRFVRGWDEAFMLMTGSSQAAQGVSAAGTLTGYRRIG